MVFRPSTIFTLAPLLTFTASAAFGSGPVEGRYVRIELPGTEAAILSVAQMEVFRGGENVARRATASQSSGRTAPGVALDGNRETFTHSAVGEANPWLEVDLGTAQPIDRLVVWNRPDRLYGRLDGFLVTLLDADRRVVWYRRYRNSLPRDMEIVPAPLEGRYVGRVLPEAAGHWYEVREERSGEVAVFPPLVDEFNPDEYEIVELRVGEVPDAAARLAKFRRRGSEAAVADLCRRFRAALDPAAPGLERFNELYEQGADREALDAYRDFFFTNMQRLPVVGMAAPNPYAAAAALEHRRVRIGDRRITVCEVGPPGAAAWAPHGLETPAGATWGRGVTGVPGLMHPFWETGAGRDAARKIDFFAEVHGPRFTAFDDLLLYYAATGSTDHLAAWMDYADDWCLFGRDDVHHSRLNLTMATELGGQEARRRIGLLRAVAEARPAFATDMRSTTLVRYLLAILEDLPPYTIRAKRTQLANWATIATTPILELSAALPEFKAAQYYGREAWRLWQSEWIHRNAPDGTNAENVRGPYRNVALGHFPRDFSASWVCDLEWREMYDKARRILRHNLGEAPQSGAGFLHRDNVAWRDAGDAFFDEPETKARMAVFAGAPGAVPDVRAELMPYGAKFVLRDGWAPDGLFFYMTNIRASSQDPLLRTEYSLSWAGQALPSSGAGIHYEAGPLYAYPLLVDRRGPHPHHDSIFPVGGKTEYLARAPRRVIDTRFHTSERFDVAEAKQDAPYALREHWAHYWMPRSPQNRFVWGPHVSALAQQDEGPIEDVTAWRQVFSVLGEGLYIVSDRVETDRAHEYARPFYLDLGPDEERLKESAAAGRPPVEKDKAARRVRTNLPDRRNLTLHFFGPGGMEFFNHFDREGNYAAFDATPRQYPVGVHWRGRGNQVLVTVHHVRNDPDDEWAAIEPTSGEGGAAGFAAVGRGGTRVWFQAGPHRVNLLAAGPAQARAECLLAVERGGELSGVVLSAASELTLRGRRFPAPAESFEYTLTAGGEFHATPIRRPIDAVRISPEQNVFTDRIEVSFAIPTQPAAEVDFHYTLDGGDPTLDSPRSTEPIVLTETALVKVRAFRRGLAATPYRQCGTDSSETFHALFRKEHSRRAVVAGTVEPGLEYTYYEDAVWGRLFAHAGEDGVLDPAAAGTVAGLLGPDAARIRRTNGPYAIVYRGFLAVPAAGVYALHAPQHLYDVTADAGFDLRVFLAGEEWRPAARLHAENTWHVAMEAGRHPFEVRFVDFRHRPFKNEYWMIWNEQTVSQGIPTLDISGPGIPRQPIPDTWLHRCFDQSP